MSDIADLGNDAAEFFLNDALSHRKPPVDPKGIGMCLNCGAPVEGEKRWCNVECREDYLRFVKVR